MNTYIALLRGINVGGNNKLPMKELRALLEEIGLKHVQTYIQSGNIVFQSERADVAALCEEITATIERTYSFAPATLLLTGQQLDAAIAANPFQQEAEEDHRSLHFFFLDPIPENPDLEAVEALRSNDERFALIDNVFYLYAPVGIGRSKLAERFGRGWHVNITARNWRTVCKLKEMVDEVAG